MRPVLGPGKKLIHYLLINVRHKHINILHSTKGTTSATQWMLVLRDSSKYIHTIEFNNYIL